MSAGYVLAIDGGQTSTKAALVDLNGRVAVQMAAGPWDTTANPAGRDRCLSSLRGVCASLPPGVVLRAACLGLTGGRIGAAMVEGWVRELVQVEGQVQVVPDFVTNLRGADPEGRPGVVVIAGGGSVAWGRDAAGREALGGAHGYLLDDEGSGYELGRRAIITVLKAHHGRRSPTALTDGLLRHFGVTDPWAIRQMIYNGGAGRPEVAGLVPVIVAAAEAGDEAARAILAEGGEALAEMALAVVRRLELSSPARVYPTGGVFRAGRWVREPFARALGAGVTVGEAVLPPLGGAAVMALEAAGALTPAAVGELVRSI